MSLQLGKLQLGRDSIAYEAILQEELWAHLKEEESKRLSEMKKVVVGHAGAVLL